MNAAAEPRVPRAAEVRDMPTRFAQLFGVFGGAVAWNAQIVSSFAVAARACAPTPVPHAPTWLWIVNVAAILLTLAALLVAWRVWRWALGQPEGEGSDPHRVQRTHALGLAGLIASGILLLGTLFALIALIATPFCGSA